VENYETPQTG